MPGPMRGAKEARRKQQVANPAILKCSVKKVRETPPRALDHGGAPSILGNKRGERERRNQNTQHRGRERAARCPTRAPGPTPTPVPTFFPCSRLVPSPHVPIQQITQFQGTPVPRPPTTPSGWRPGHPGPVPPLLVCSPRYVPYCHRMGTPFLWACSPVLTDSRVDFGMTGNRYTIMSEFPTIYMWARSDLTGQVYLDRRDWSNFVNLVNEIWKIVRCNWTVHTRVNSHLDFSLTENFFGCL